MIVKKFLLKDTYEKLIEYYSKKCDVIMFVTKTDGFNDELKNQLMDNITEVEKKLKASFIKN